MRILLRNQAKLEEVALVGYEQNKLIIPKIAKIMGVTGGGKLVCEDYLEITPIIALSLKQQKCTFKFRNGNFHLIEKSKKTFVLAMDMLEYKEKVSIYNDGEWMRKDKAFLKLMTTLVRQNVRIEGSNSTPFADYLLHLLK